MNEGASRPYRMTARAQATQATGERIVAASLALYHELWLDEITLDKVAERAGVSTKTLLRRFGSREGLVASVSQVLAEQVAAQRFAARVGDVEDAVDNLMAHYERHGSLALRNGVQAQRFAPVQALVAHGREEHHRWVEHVFSPWLDARAAPERDLLLAQLIAVTDVTVWQVLRGDLGLDRPRTAQAVRGLLHAVLDSPTSDQPVLDHPAHDKEVP